MDENGLPGGGVKMSKPIDHDLIGEGYHLQPLELQLDPITVTKPYKGESNGEIEIKGSWRYD